MATVSRRGTLTLHEITVKFNKDDFKKYAIEQAQVKLDQVYDWDWDFDFEEDDIIVSLKIKEMGIQTAGMKLCSCDPRPAGQIFSSSSICQQCKKPTHHYANRILLPCCDRNGSCMRPKNLGKECEFCGSEYHESKYHRDP